MILGISTADSGRSSVLRRRIARVVSLRAADWRMLAEALATLAIVQVALRVVEFPCLLAWATRTRPPAGREWSRADVEQAAWLVNVGGRLTHLRCLAKSLTLARLLGRRGVPSQVQIGVRVEDGKLQAHAWVEHMGRPLIDSDRRLRTYAAFERAQEHISNA